MAQNCEQQKPILLEVKPCVIQQWAKDKIELEELRRIDSLKSKQLQYYQDEVVIRENTLNRVKDECSEKVHTLDQMVRDKSKEIETLKKHRLALGGTSVGLVILVLLLAL